MKQNDIFEDDNEGIFHFKLKENAIETMEHKILEEMKVKAFKETFTAKLISNPHVPGAKLDGEKPMLDLVLGDFAKAMVEVGKVGTMGAKKYTPHGWLSVDRAETRYLSAMLRHYYNYKDEDESDIDKESGISHLAHMAWNSLASLELYLRNNK